MQWEQLLLSLYKNIKQKDTFGMQYKLLILCTTLRSLFKRNKKNYERIECVRSNRADEKKKHWLFSWYSSQNIFIYLLCLLEYIDITQVIDNTVEVPSVSLLRAWERSGSKKRTFRNIIYNYWIFKKKGNLWKEIY